MLLVFSLVACESEDTSDQPSADDPANSPDTEQMEQSTNRTEIDEVTDEELQKFVNVMLKAEEQRIGNRSELRELLEEEDLEMWRFEEIEAATQRDAELRQRRNEMTQETRGNL